MLLGVVVISWGASFLLIDVAVEHLRPALVALLRLAFGTGTLALVPAARRGVPRTAWPAIATLGVVWMAVPFVLFPFAEQRISSSLAGMLNAAAPLFTALVAALVSRRLPDHRHRTGLVVGLIGVTVVCSPSLAGAQATLLGVGLVLLATLLYGIAFNLAPALQQQHGALPVIWRAQLTALALTAPVGLASIPGSRLAGSSVLAVAALGFIGTALAFVAFTTLSGRVGSTRAAVTVYFCPAVAILLGWLAHGEPIADRIDLRDRARRVRGVPHEPRRDETESGRPAARAPPAASSLAGRRTR